MVAQVHGVPVRVGCGQGDGRLDAGVEPRGGPNRVRGVEVDCVEAGLQQSAADHQRRGDRLQPCQRAVEQFAHPDQPVDAEHQQHRQHRGAAKSVRDAFIGQGCGDRADNEARHDEPGERLVPPSPACPEPEQQQWRRAKLDCDLGDTTRHPLTRAQIERDALPAPVVDMGLERDESLGVRRLAELVRIARHRLPPDRPRRILAGDGGRSGAGPVDRPERSEHLHLLVANRRGAELGRRLHRHEGEELEHVVLNHVA